MPRFLPRSPDMVVNIEWPGFASDALPLLPEDQQLDAESSDPGSQRFEKLASGLYLGDLARRLLLRCVLHWLLGICIEVKCWPAHVHKILSEWCIPDCLRTAKRLSHQCSGC